MNRWSAYGAKKVGVKRRTSLVATTSSGYASSASRYSLSQAVLRYHAELCEKRAGHTQVLSEEHQTVGCSNKVLDHRERSNTDPSC